MSYIPGNRNRPGDLEANRNNGYRASGDTPPENQTYQSTILPASATDFEPEPHKPLFRQFGNPAPLGLCGFALTTFVLSLINVQARSVTHPNIVVGLGITSPKAFIDISACLWRICSILRRNVGVCHWQYFRCACVQFLWCILDQLRLYLHPVLQHLNS
jgi:hypothetical protein